MARISNIVCVPSDVVMCLFVAESLKVPEMLSEIVLFENGLKISVDKGGDMAVSKGEYLSISNA